LSLEHLELAFALVLLISSPTSISIVTIAPTSTSPPIIASATTPAVSRREPRRRRVPPRPARRRRRRRRRRLSTFLRPRPLRRDFRLATRDRRLRTLFFAQERRFHHRARVFAAFLCQVFQRRRGIPLRFVRHFRSIQRARVERCDAVARDAFESLSLSRALGRASRARVPRSEANGCGCVERERTPRARDANDDRRAARERADSRRRNYKNIITRTTTPGRNRKCYANHDAGSE
jgi:hypothetical protein|tara:strand:- start:964 stop:1668 length:705 start_codon:yes stop_codon:yes gene_type:complete